MLVCHQIELEASQYVPVFVHARRSGDETHLEKLRMQQFCLKGIVVMMKSLQIILGKGQSVFTLEALH